MPGADTFVGVPEPDEPAGPVTARGSPGPARQARRGRRLFPAGVATAAGLYRRPQQPGQRTDVTGRGLQEAVISYQRALQLLPATAAATRARLFSHLCNVLRQQGNLSEALVYGRRALELQPDFAEAQATWAPLYTSTGNLPRRWPATVGQSAQAGLCRGTQQPGQCVKDQGNLDEAVACCRPR